MENFVGNVSTAFIAVCSAAFFNAMCSILVEASVRYDMGKAGVRGKIIEGKWFARFQSLRIFALLIVIFFLMGYLIATGQFPPGFGDDYQPPSDFGE